MKNKKKKVFKFSDSFLSMPALFSPKQWLSQKLMTIKARISDDSEFLYYKNVTTKKKESEKSENGKESIKRFIFLKGKEVTRLFYTFLKSFLYYVLFLSNFRKLRLKMFIFKSIQL